MTKDMTALWQKYRLTGSVELRNRIAEEYLPLVKIVCSRLAMKLPQSVDKDDLLQSGFFGLLESIERFDITRNIKFETYAGLRIRGAMLDYLRAKDWLPVSLRQKIRKYEQTAQSLENQLGRAPTDDEVAGAMQISVEEMQNLVNTLTANVQPLTTNGALADEYTDPRSNRAAQLFELKETLTKAIENLEPKERTVVTLYYYEELTLKEISLILHLTEARISQLHTKAIMKMREYLSQIKDELF